jgi:prepilin-type N-terminal cleavage/methylation domain-containing protein
MNQRGFTLVEFLVAMAVSTLVITAVAPIIFQLFQGTSTSSGKAVALRDIDVAAHWLTRDLGQALTTDLIDLAPPVSTVTLTWNDLTTYAVAAESVSHSVTYTQVGTQLQRNYDGEVILIADYLANVEFSIDGRLITISITSAPDVVTPDVAETKIYTVYLRPEQ